MNKEQLTEFLDRLYGPEGCNFHKKNGQLVWRCAGGNDKSHARKILAAMKVPSGEVSALLKLCNDLGGYCDCEILFNAAEDLEECLSDQEYE